MSGPFDQARDRWEPWEETCPSGGPERTAVDEAHPGFVSHPVGFAPPSPPPEREPNLWEGDQA